MRGQVSEWVCYTQGVSPLRRRVTFWTARKSPKNRQGAGAIGGSASLPPPCRPSPGPPFTGATPEMSSNASGAQNLSGGQRFLPAHWGLIPLKLQGVRFHNRAWLFSANAPGPAPAVGATLAVARKPSPRGRTIPPIRGKWPKAKRGREARPKVVTDEGNGSGYGGHSFRP